MLRKEVNFKGLLTLIQSEKFPKKYTITLAILEYSYISMKKKNRQCDCLSFNQDSF